MARVKNEEDLLLKKRARRRLVGSVVLVIIAIIVLPMILERVPKQERKEVEIIIPSEVLSDEPSAVVTQEDSVPGTVPAPINATTGPDTESNVSKEVITEAEQVKEKKSDLLIKPIQTKKEQAGRIVRTEDNHKDKKPTVTIEKFVVQLGAFSDSTKAKRQQRSLTSNGIKKAYTETIKNKNTKVTRVRVGPFATREAAEKEQKKLRKLGINGVVMSK